MTTPRNLSFLAQGASATGVLDATYGGTGQSSITTGDLLYGSASNTISKLAIGSTGTILRVVAGIPSWGTDYVGTVTSVAALTLGTTGTDLSSTVANGTTTPVITLNVPTASATNRGALSSTDWSTFNGKAPAVTYTTGYVPYGQGTTSLNQSSGLYFSGANLGIGTTSPVNYGAPYPNLTINGSTTGVLDIQSNGTTQLEFSTGTNYAQISATAASGVLAFTSGGNTERMRISASGGVSIGNTTDPGATNLSVTGQLFVGATSTVASSYAGVKFNGAAYNGFGLNDSAAASGTGYIYFQSNGTTIGSIARVAATSAVVYNTTSDERLKTNIADASLVLDKLMDVKVRQYDWIDGDLHQDAGFIAQELEPILSGIVTKGKTEEDMWQLDYSRLTPYLVKAMQEQQTLIESLTQRIAILEAK